jgi:urease beta subunit
LAFGHRLNIPAGTAVRFEPGDDKKIKLVRLGGAAKVLGLNALTTGATDASAIETAVERADARGFANVKS